MAATSVHDLFQQALRRSRHPVSTAAVHDDDGACARFDLQWCDGRVAAATYQCATCITLVALCERASHRVIGMDRAEVEALSPERLMEDLPGIPTSRRGRADLAARALRASLPIE